MPKRNLALIAAIIAAAACVVFFTHGRPAGVDINRRGDPQLAPLAEARDIIRRNYIQQVKDEKLVSDAIGGMVEGLDEFSKYVPPEKLSAFNSRMNGSYRGVGLKVEIILGRVVVIGPILGSPADREGFRTGDTILSIDDQDVRGLTLPQVNDLLDGGARNSVNIVFQRGSRRMAKDLTRGETELETVVGLFRDPQGRWVYMLDEKEGVAYIRLREFCPKTADQLGQALRQFRNLRSVVLDLRDNPGGGLVSAVSTANLFIRDGLIVKSVDRSGRQELYRAHPEKIYSDSIPLVVLVNGWTASAAEIVAGSLWLKSRAVLVGARTRGKGCVQSLFPLGQGLGQISLTTSEYLLDGDIRISRRGGIGGIAPDLQALPTNEDDLAALRLRGEVLFQPTPETMPASWPAGGADMTPTFLSLDKPLAAALNILRASEEYKAIMKQAADSRKTWSTTAPGAARGADE